MYTYLVQIKVNVSADECEVSLVVLNLLLCTVKVKHERKQ